MAVASEATEYEYETFGLDSRPVIKYATMIKEAINSSPSQKVTLNGIYIYILNNFPYFKTAGNGWKNSIRHNLSLNKAFIRVPRPSHEKGKGAYWMVNKEFEEGRKYGGRKGGQQSYCPNLDRPALRDSPTKSSTGFRYDKANFTLESGNASTRQLFTPSSTMPFYHNGNVGPRATQSVVGNTSSYMPFVQQPFVQQESSPSKFELDMNRYFAYDNDATINHESSHYDCDGPFIFASASDLMDSYNSGDSNLNWDGFVMGPE